MAPYPLVSRLSYTYYCHRCGAYYTSNELWIRKWTAYSEPMTSHLLGRLAGSRWTLLYMQQRAAGGLYGRHLQSMTSYPSVDVYFIEEQSCHISPLSDLVRRNLRLSWRASPGQQQQEDAYRYWISSWPINKPSLSMLPSVFICHRSAKLNS